MTVEIVINNPKETSIADIERVADEFNLPEDIISKPIFVQGASDSYENG